MPSRCTVPGCNTKMASYRDTSSGGTLCEKHARAGRGSLSSSLVRIHCQCQHVGCLNRARYALTPDHASGLWCREHKSSEMWDITKKRCRYDAEFCRSEALYNLPGQAAAYCFWHKGLDMIIIYAKPCEAPDCQKTSMYNDEGQQLSFCKVHSPTSKPCCTEPDCKMQPSFSYSREQKATHCSKHREEGMINVKSACRHESGCNLVARFNVPGSRTAYFCIKHKLPQMIRVRKRDHICQYENCSKSANFNLPGIKGKRFCNQHKTPEMMDVNRNPCKTDGCTAYASKNARYEGYCWFCFAHLFPDKPMARQFRTKERVIGEFLRSTHPQYDWVYDRRVTEGCSRRRPDFLLDLGFQVLIVEVDEHQHAMKYTEACENRRMMELSQDVGHRPLVIVRFNPDSYIDENGERVPGCWGVSARIGAVNVLQKHKRAWQTRLATLQKCVSHWIQTPTTKMVEVVYLFYSQAEANGAQERQEHSKDGLSLRN